MSLQPRRHESKCCFLDQGDAQVLFRLFEANRTVQNTLDDDAILAELKKYKRPGEADRLFTDYFLYGNDAEVVRRWRLTRLRRLYRSLSVPNSKGELTVAYYRVTPEGGKAGYMHVMHIIGDPFLEEQVLNQIRHIKTVARSLAHQASIVLKECRKALSK